MHFERERDMPTFNIIYIIIYIPTFNNIYSEDDQIHLNPAVILFTPALHFERQSAYVLLKPTFILSSSTCLFHVFFDFQPQDLMPSRCDHPLLST